MGIQQSSITNEIKPTETQTTYDYFNVGSAKDLLIDILSFVPYEDLIRNCRLVCKDWKEIIDGHSVWKLKCERKGVQVPKCTKTTIPDNYYRYIFFHSETSGNLIRNPCGDEQLEGWQIFEVGGDGLKVENPPEGADPVPAVVGSQSCFVTSYYECRKYQEIDLYKNKVHEYLLKNDVVKIRVGDWYAARFDCSSEYELIVTLLDETKKQIDEFTFKYTEEQWQGREWHNVTHEFTEVTKVRYIWFDHAGQDRQFWAGHYGSKFTGAFVELYLKV